MECINTWLNKTDEKMLQLEERVKERQDFLSAEIDSRASSEDLSFLKMKTLKTKITINGNRVVKRAFWVGLGPDSSLDFVKFWSFNWAGCRGKIKIFRE